MKAVLPMLCRAPTATARGRRCIGSQDGPALVRTHVIGALLGSLLMAVGLFSCSINSAIFYAGVMQLLVPALPPHCIIVMNNASFHQRQDIQQAMSKAGYLLDYLPPYSPVLNPIEHTWAQAKRKRRTLQCSIDTLFSEYIV